MEGCGGEGAGSCEGEALGKPVLEGVAMKIG